MTLPFVGFENYSELLVYDTRFIYAVIRTFLISTVCLCLEFSFGLGLAVLFMRKFRGKSVLFSAFLTPMMILPVVVGYIFWMLFQSNGPINQVLEFLFGADAMMEWFKSAPPRHLRSHSDRSMALDAAFFSDSALRVELCAGEPPCGRRSFWGANPRQVFWRVIMPTLKPVIIVAFVIRAMEIIKLFDEVFMLTRGGPGSSTETISLYIYKLAFNDFQLAYGAAAAFLVLVGSLFLVHMLLAPVRDQLLEGE